MTSAAASSTAGLVVTSGFFNQGNATSTGSTHYNELCDNSFMCIATSSPPTYATSTTARTDIATIAAATSTPGELGTQHGWKVTFSIESTDDSSGNSATLTFKLGGTTLGTQTVSNDTTETEAATGTLWVYNDGATNRQRWIKCAVVVSSDSTETGSNTCTTGVSAVNTAPSIGMSVDQVITNGGTMVSYAIIERLWAY